MRCRTAPTHARSNKSENPGVGRRKLPPGDPAYFDGDIYPLDGITQLYLMLANDGH